MTGTANTRLVILRGPSGAGKSTVARALRERMGRGTALVEQDYLRRVLLREKDEPGAPNIDLIDVTVRYLLDAGHGVVLEGILARSRYGEMLGELVAAHDGTTVCAYLDVPFAETVRRHAVRPQAHDFTPDEMATWWEPDDRLGLPGEVVLSAASMADESVAGILEALDRGDDGPRRR